MTTPICSRRRNNFDILGSAGRRRQVEGFDNRHIDVTVHPAGWWRRPAPNGQGKRLDLRPEFVKHGKSLLYLLIADAAAQDPLVFVGERRVERDRTARSLEIKHGAEGGAEAGACLGHQPTGKES